MIGLLHMCFDPKRIIQLYFGPCFLGRLLAYKSNFT